MKNHNIYARKEEGAALITALLFLVIITALGMAAIWTASTEKTIAENHLKSKEALYMAEAGMQDAIAQLDGQGLPGVPDLDLAAHPPPPPNGTGTAADCLGWSHDINRTMGNLSYSVHITYKHEDSFHYDSDGNANDDVVLYNSAPVTSDGGFNYPNAKISTAGKGPVVFYIKSVGTVYGGGGANGSTMTLYADVSKDTINTAVPAGFYSASCLPINGISSKITGIDPSGVGATLPGVTSANPCPLTPQQVAAGVIAGNGGAVETLQSPAITMDTSSNSFLKMSMTDLEAQATHVYPDPGPPVTDLQNNATYGSETGDVTSPQIIVCTQAETVQNLKGYGLLYVNGDLTLNGGFDWHGLVYVTGNVVLTGGGTVQYNIDGAIMAGGLFNSVGAGTIGVAYNQQILNELTQWSFKSKIIEWHQDFQ